MRTGDLVSDAEVQRQTRRRAGRHPKALRKNFAGVGELCGIPDGPWAALVDDLDAKGLLAKTVLLWMGGFAGTASLTDGGRQLRAKAWPFIRHFRSHYNPSPGRYET